MARLATPTWSRSIAAALARQLESGVDATVDCDGWRLSIVVEDGGYTWQVRPLHPDGPLFFHGRADTLDAACRQACQSLELCMPAPGVPPLSGRVLHHRIDRLLERNPELLHVPPRRSGTR